MTEQLSDKSKQALINLLYQLADDDFILAFRGSEWLGLAPHIEEDVAYSSINQDTMGHAAMFYKLLEDLGEGDVDELSHARKSTLRKNAVMLELANGPGHYLKEPNYDWAFTVVRNYYYSQAKKVKIDSLKQSSYKPLADAAVKVSMELYYHLLHWTVWFKQLIQAGGEAKEKMINAIKKAEADFGDVLSLGPLAEDIVQSGFIESETVLTQAFHKRMDPVFQGLSIPYSGRFQQINGKGRYGEHTEELVQALDTINEVYKINPKAVW
ncbi:phenylacetate-CoA oxygenase subunit PaaI [Jeotgalibacillus sp. S-D1]|uniref:1,2-phenylacetyl-CoA epoxidase subunit PaaC n=1 Tax=Jeotgalibacillus sp. S-D1 TaxID=2552189 RepID=UPI00105A0F26|nr:1,2-phenylacetyl-CoA epoxidase subunit PaaC [Jeotgalibacillus sp. S-D1]TDL35274.1 phenylacetate-CoA oxygenase subunit PaaI [Jeotgalibacillus sp. S-D1]